jgi:NAD(P) transhydrogenase
MPAKEYDLVVIGSGPAGEKGAAQAAYFGKKVALIEKQSDLGGAAANTGTLPSKTLRETALYLSGFKQRGLYGIHLTVKDRVTARDFLYRERLVAESERARVSDNLGRHKVELFTGQAEFVDAHTLQVKSPEGEATLLRGKVILIATGSTPYRPANLPFEHPGVFDSDTILQIEKLPDSMLVAGGGVIGCEYACMFAALGIDVTLMEGRATLLGFMDAEISAALTSHMEMMGIKIVKPDAIESVIAEQRIRVQLKSGRELGVDFLLAATGRSGNTAGLGLENHNVETNKRGQILVNENYQTAVPHIYAAGDVIGFPALASTSMEQARLAMVHAFDLRYKEDLAQILPYGIYTIPECSMAGETEESLTRRQIPYVAGRARYNANARGQIIGDDDGFLKLLFHAQSRKLLGVHVMGEQASELVHTGLTAMLMGATTDLFIQTCYNYPTLTEMYKYATYDALGKISEGEHED